MRKILVLLAIIFGTATIAFAQVSYSTVTATVTDPNGNPYANASLTANLVSSAGYPVSSASTPNGQLFNAKQVLATLDATGHFSIQLVPNNILSNPSGTQWKISIVYPQNTAILTTQSPWTTNYSLSITGPIDLSSQISSLTQSINFINLATGQSTLVSTRGCQGGNTVANGCTGANAFTPEQLLQTGATSTSPLQSSSIIIAGAGSSQVSTFPGNVTAASTTTGGYTGTALTAKLTLAQLPGLAAVMASYRHDLFQPIWLAATGTSLCVGATLTNPSVNSPCSYMMAQIAQQLDPAGNYSTFPWQPKDYNFQLANFGSNGNFAYGNNVPGGIFTYMAGSPNGVTLANGGTGGAAVGQVGVIEQGTCSSINPPTPISTCAAESSVIVTQVDSGATGGPGIVTGIQLSAYPNYEPATVTAEQSYTVATNVPVVAGPNNGYAYGTGIPGTALTATGVEVNITGVGIVPTVLGSLWGSNESTITGYGGVTGYGYNSFKNFFNTFLQIAQADPSVSFANSLQGLGADVVVMTMPQPPVLNANTENYAFSGTLSGNYPTSGTWTNMTIFPPLSCTPVAPATACISALDYSNWASAYPTTFFSIDTRYWYGNVLMRTAAAQAMRPAPVVDIEHGYFSAMASYIAAGGTQIGAENSFYCTSNIHPCAGGASAFYYPVINQAVSGLQNSPDQTGASNNNPTTTPDGKTTLSAKTLVGNIIITTSVPVTLTIPPLSTVKLHVTMQASPYRNTYEDYGISSCAAFMTVTDEGGSNTSGVTPLFYPSVPTGANSGTVLTLNANFTGSLQYQIQSQTDAVSSCVSSASSVIVPYGTSVQPYTATTSATLSDNGKLVQMNCSTACAYNLYTHPSPTWHIWLQSIGSHTATIALASNTFNGTSSVPVLNNFRIVPILANTSTPTDYVGDSPLVAGANVTITPAANGMVIAAASSGSGTVSSGSGYAIPSYASGSGTTVGPSNITTDSTGNNLILPSGGILVITNDGLHPGQFALPWETTANAAPTNATGWEGAVSASGTAGWFDLPSALPTAQSIMLFGGAASSHSVGTTATTLPATMLPAVTTTVSSGSIAAITTNNTYVICTTTCNVTPLQAAVGVQFCVRNAPGSATVITLNALGASNYYELTTHAGWGTANHSLVSGGVATDSICLLGYDATHYAVMSYTGTWTD